MITLVWIVCYILIVALTTILTSYIVYMPFIVEASDGSFMKFVGVSLGYMIASAAKIPQLARTLVSVPNQQVIDRLIKEYNESTIN